uniref:Uncharacterized protein n=1 Tax=Anopheles culicifacies TaxID=139723 RepID=A0A182LYE7_9DIPT
MQHDILIIAKEESSGRKSKLKEATEEPKVAAAKRKATGDKKMGFDRGLIPEEIIASFWTFNRMAERPITQHGISGLSTSYGRLGTAASNNRQIKDKRYWHAVLQSKIQEINQETGKLLKEKKFLDRERSARKLYEKRVKEAAKELTNLQSTLTSMNLALDNCTSGMTRQHLLNETVALRERNEHIQEQLELIFKQRQQKDSDNKDLERETEKEKNKVIEMINSLPEEDQHKYREYQTLSENLRKQNAIYHTQISEMEKQKERLNTMIMNSQTRSEAHRLKSKLKELLNKRNALREEENNRLSPAQEREKLINDVRSNNQALASIGKQLKIVEDQLIEKKETLQQIDQDLEEGNSERHVKYKELKKRDEVMSAFMDSFKSNMNQEQQSKAVLLYLQVQKYSKSVLCNSRYRYIEKPNHICNRANYVARYQHERHRRGQIRWERLYI